VTTHAYEVLLMLDPEQPEERQEEIVTRTRELIESRGGTIEKHDPWGRRKLAYEIDHKTEGTYHLLLFTSDADTLDELSRILKITDGVMRHLAVRRPEGKTTSAAETPTTDSTAPAEAA
jgi:small subunit ribosomal protein S6